MDVTQAIENRRAYRSLEPVEITKELIEDLASHARLAPSCNNNQPWRFVFVYDPGTLFEMRAALSANNDWIHAASMIVAVFSKKEDDCVIKDREYDQFDCGLASAFLILRATELGLVAHPIAGFSPKKTKEILGIPEQYRVITLINIGKKAATLNPILTPKQVEQEKTRPERQALDDFVFLNHYRSISPP